MHGIAHNAPFLSANSTENWRVLLHWCMKHSNDWWPQSPQHPRVDSRRSSTHCTSNCGITNDHHASRCCTQTHDLAMQSMRLGTLWRALKRQTTEPKGAKWAIFRSKIEMGSLGSAKTHLSDVQRGTTKMSPFLMICVAPCTLLLGSRDLNSVFYL